MNSENRKIKSEAFSNSLPLHNTDTETNDDATITKYFCIYSLPVKRQRFNIVKNYLHCHI